MSYDDLLRDGRIREHPADHDDIVAALTIAQARLGDAGLDGLSNDGRFIFAYDAARSAAEAIIGAAGYRPVAGAGHHETVFQFLRVVHDGRWATEAVEFEQARRKRNAAEYGEWGLITATEADRLLEVAAQFVGEVGQLVADTSEEDGASPGDQ
jgi:hypothetical protein